MDGMTADDEHKIPEPWHSREVFDPAKARQEEWDLLLKQGWTPPPGATPADLPISDEFLRERWAAFRRLRLRQARKQRS